MVPLVLLSLPLSAYIHHGREGGNPCLTLTAFLFSLGEKVPEGRMRGVGTAEITAGGLVLPLIPSSGASRHLLPMGEGERPVYPFGPPVPITLRTMSGSAAITRK